jgi:hypothetical protein
MHYPLCVNAPSLLRQCTLSTPFVSAGLVYGFQTRPKVRPIYHHTRGSIEAHLTIVFAAMAVSHVIEHQTGWGIKKFVRTTRIVKIKAAREILTAA